MKVDPVSNSPRLATALIDWQRAHGRHTLPWQNTRDPYLIWLSEIMLQQTQVATVIGYYQRFLASYPSVERLAAAPQDAVLALWSGLGYYSRARNLHAAAQMVMTTFGGQFPTNRLDLERLPGVGRSTAAAIAAFAFGATEAILDGNVKRVLSRYFGLPRAASEARWLTELWPVAERELPDHDIERYTQGLMDLGATVCTARAPLCATCPVARQCVALQQGRTAELPGRRLKKIIPERSTTLLLMVNELGEIALEKRPPTGIWGALWSLPEWSADHTTQPTWATPTAPLSTFATLTHTFTHFKLHIRVCIVRVAEAYPPLSVKAPNHQQWVSAETALTMGIPKPIRVIVEQYLQAPLLAPKP